MVVGLLDTIDCWLLCKEMHSRCYVSCCHRVLFSWPILSLLTETACVPFIILFPRRLHCVQWGNQSLRLGFVAQFGEPNNAQCCEAWNSHFRPTTYFVCIIIITFLSSPKLLYGHIVSCSIYFESISLCHKTDSFNMCKFYIQLGSLWIFLYYHDT